MIVEVLITQTQPQHPLLDQRFDRMLDAIRIPMIGKALAQPTQNPGPIFHYAHDDAMGVEADLATVEPAHDIPSV